MAIAITVYTYMNGLYVPLLKLLRNTKLWIDFVILGQEDPLEEGMATHSSMLFWEIPWTENPGRLQFMGLQKSQTQLSN